MAQASLHIGGPLLGECLFASGMFTFASPLGWSRRGAFWDAISAGVQWAAMSTRQRLNGSCVKDEGKEGLADSLHDGEFRLKLMMPALGKVPRQLLG